MKTDPDKDRVTPSFPLNMVRAAIAAMVLLLCAATYLTIRIGEEQETATRSQIDVLTAAHHVEHYGTVLELSIKAVAKSADREAAERYEAVQPKLRAAIVELRKKLRLKENQVTAARLDEVDLALVSMEKEVIARARKGQLQEAGTVIESQKYERLLKVYYRSIDTIQARANAFIAKTEAQLRWYLYGDLALTMAAFSLIILGWIAIVLPARRWGDRLAEAEEARRQADALYRAYFENTPEALFVVRVEPEGFFIEEMNPAHEAGFGSKLEDVQGRRINEILPPEVARRVMARYRQVVQTGEVLQYREVFDLTGSSQHWDTSLVPVRDEAGFIIRLMGSSRNVTAQVFAEEALRHSQKMEAMGSLTGGVAHDFNNLLTPIVGSLDMLQRKRTQDEREKRLIAGALQSAEKAKTLVQRLLSFARRQPLQPVAVDVSKLIFGMSELVSSTIGPQVKVVLQAPDVLPPAKADPNQLEMALLNLCVNARDAMSEGGTLRISASAETVERRTSSALAPGAYIRLSVEDTGTGMDEETLQRAVEPFFSTKGIGRGTGLGLSMVHGLAAQLGGALLIHSRAGFGTNVELWLPQSNEALESDDAPTETAALHSGRGTALLVDDEELVRTSTADMLGELGYTVKEAQSAEEALRLINDGLLVDLVVTDHLMPGMTGTQLAYELRARWPGMPLLVISGYADVDGIAPELPRLVKPYRQVELAAKLAELTAGRRDI